VAPERRGPALALASLYALFALAAGARSGVQLATRAGEAPLPYALSALAAATYRAVAVVLQRGGPRAPRRLRLLCGVELAGVLVVGTLSLLAPADFPDATVWSLYGAGYGCVPLVLPLLGLWLARDGGRAPVLTRPRRGARARRGA
jgi:hypothetical protein